jgi:hypothetical protein
MNVETTGVLGHPDKRSYLAAAAGMLRGYALVQGANDQTLAIASVANAPAFAILEESNVNAGDTISAVFVGEAVAVIGSAVTAGQYLVTNAAGQLVPATGASNQNIVARAVSSGSNAGDYIVVFVSPDSGPTQEQVTHYVAAGAIPVASGAAGIGSAGALAMTLAQPTAAQDGTTLFITAETAHAHTVTTAANGINGAKHVVTFAAQGDGAVLEAMATVWNVRGLIGTATLT